ncbi:MAG: hypothetical protein EOM25_09280 [Deltaproteobacteria bacterium]|nr:hypothetical protein [Deltaproteobacteria bacterium]
MMKTLSIGVGWMMVLLLPGLGLAFGIVERIGDTGQVDWGRMVVSASGVGAPPAQSVNAAQARAMAKRSAVVAARRNLLEVVQGVRIDSATEVRDYMVQSDRIRSEVHGLLENSRIIETRTLPDGGVEAVVGIPLNGELSRILFPQTPKTHPTLPPVVPPSAPVVDTSGLETRMAALERSMSGLTAEVRSVLQRVEVRLTALEAEAVKAADARKSETPIPTENSAVLAPVLEALRTDLAALTVRVGVLETAGPVSAPTPTISVPSYTGLVIDARGVGFKPCLKPLVYDGLQTQIYPGEYVDADTAVRSGYVRYYSALASAEQSGITGDLPMKAKAVSIGIGGAGTLVLGPEDADILASVIRAGGGFLSRCKVAIVL